MLEVGQELWYVPADSRFVASQSRSVRVEKIGRKWASLNTQYRIDINTLWADGGQYSSPGRCWLSRDAWLAEQRRHALWDRLWNLVDRYRVTDIPENAIMAAIKVLEDAVLGQSTSQKED